MQVQQRQASIKEFFDRPDVKGRFEEIMGKRSSAFIASVLQVASDDTLKDSDPISVYQAASVAATLDLPINKSLGFAYIIGYKQRQNDGTYKTMAQFQMGYRGFIQLAQRTGQFKTISAAPIYEGQLVGADPLKGYEFDFSKKESDKIIGYAAYFALLNGFEKTLYMSVPEMNAHAKRFSQTFKKGFGLWKDDFDAMAMKTVLKLLLSKFAPLSVEMQTAIRGDQAVMTEDGEVEYVDAEAEVINKEQERITLMIHDCASVADLESLYAQVGDDMNEDNLQLYLTKKEELS